MENNYKYEEDFELDFAEIFFAIWNKRRVILLMTLLFALIGLYGAMFYLPCTYKSTTSVYVSGQQSEVSSYSNLQTGIMMTKDYEVLVKGRNVLEEVISKLNLNLSYESLKSMITVNVPENTRIVEITVESIDPYLSQDIADTVRQVSGENIVKVMGVGAVSVVEKANLPKGKSGPNLKRYMLLGGVSGAVVASGITLLAYVLNDNICTQDDVERYLGLNTLGLIPLDEKLKKREKKRRKKK